MFTEKIINNKKKLYFEEILQKMRIIPKKSSFEISSYKF